jgi:hypothetical protein
MGPRPIQADEKCWTYSRARLTEPRPSGSGNAKDGVIESGMLIGFPRCSPPVCFSTEW